MVVGVKYRAQDKGRKAFQKEFQRVFRNENSYILVIINNKE